MESIETVAGKDAEVTAADLSPVTRPLQTEAMAPHCTSRRTPGPRLSPSPRTASSPAGGAPSLPAALGAEIGAV